jgi:hypothetical protein
MNESSLLIIVQIATLSSQDEIEIMNKKQGQLPLIDLLVGTTKSLLSEHVVGINVLA